MEKQIAEDLKLMLVENPHGYKGREVLILADVLKKIDEKVDFTKEDATFVLKTMDQQSFIGKMANQVKQIYNYLIELSEGKK
jgi:hypothetical protein